MAAYLDHSSRLALNLSVHVYEGRALIAGFVETAEDMADAVGLAWKVASVEEVINEIHVRPPESILDTAGDSAPTGGGGWSVSRRYASYNNLSSFQGRCPRFKAFIQPARMGFVVVLHL